MAKKLYVRNAENTNWVEIGTSVPNIQNYLTQSSASVTYATIAYVDEEISNIDLTPYATKIYADAAAVSASAAAVTYLIDAAPESLNTLNELAAALNDDANFAGTVTTALAGKLDISSASSTYLTQTNASGLYLTQSSASTTYATKTEVENLDLLPDQTGNDGKYLTTNGASASWGLLDIPPSAVLQSASPVGAEAGQIWVDSDASASYLNTNDFLLKADAQIEYLNKVNASASYAPIVPLVQTGFRNKIINGGFDIWQRGTSFSGGGYTADRWNVVAASGQTVAVSQQSFTVGNQISGYEPSYFLRTVWSGTPSGFFWLTQKLEDVRTFAGQTITLSFWAKGSSSTSAFSPIIEQNFGSGGSSLVTTFGTTLNLTTSWQRFSQTFYVPSISGKTIGTSSFLEIRPLAGNTSVAGNNIDIWGVQVESGSVATPFEQRPIGTELSLCQRYFVRLVPSAANVGFARGYQWNATSGQVGVYLPVSLRGTPTLAYSALTDFACLGGAGWVNPTSLSITGYSQNMVDLTIGFSGGSIGRAQYLEALNTNAWLSFSSEL